jgi:hypothetical protein
VGAEELEADAREPEHLRVHEADEELVQREREHALEDPAWLLSLRRITLSLQVAPPLH